MHILFQHLRPASTITAGYDTSSFSRSRFSLDPFETSFMR